MKPLYLDRAEVEARAAKVDIPAALHQILIDLAEGQAGLSVRSELIPEQMQGLMGIMPAYRAAAPALFAAKVVCVMPQNPAKGLPAHQGFCVLYDGQDGHVIGMAEAGSVTELRTAAMAVLASQTLAQRQENLLFLGSGHQVLPHIAAFARAYPKAEIELWARRSEAAHEIAMAAAETGITVKVVEALEPAIGKADIITTLTSSKTPLFPADWLKSTTHVNAMGSSTHFVREFGEDLIVQSDLYVDHIASVLQLAGEFQALSAKPNPVALYDAISGKSRPNPAQPTLFKSVGIALQDLAILDKILRNKD